jgi:hypothetical protein
LKVAQRKYAEQASPDMPLRSVASKVNLNQFDLNAKMYMAK